MSSEGLLFQIKNIPVAEVIGHYIPLKSRGSNYLALCPFHDDKNPSLQVNEKRGSFKCFACDTGGDGVDFVQKYKNLPFREALLEIAERFNLPVDDFKSGRRANPLEAMAKRVNNAALRIYTHCAKSRQYPKFTQFVQERKLSREIVTQFALGYAPGNNALTHYLSTEVEEGEREQALTAAQEIGLIRPSQKRPGEFYDTFRNRIMFPIWNQYDKLLGFGSRAVFDYQKGKYVNSQESFLFSKKFILYGLNFAKQSIRDKGQVILVEGHMDCLALVKNGLPNVVAAMGVAISPTMAKTLAKMASDIILGLDSDDAGFKATRRINELFLQEELLPCYLDYSPYKDADEFLAEESRIKLMEKIEQAPKLLDLLIQREIGESIPMNTDRRLLKLRSIFNLLKPLKQSLLATERVIVSAKKLGLQSTNEQILENYREFLAGQKFSSIQTLPPELVPDEEDISPPSSPTIELSKADHIIVENFSSHPECFKAKNYQELLDYVSCHEVQQLVRLLKDVYFEVNEGHYPKMAQEALKKKGINSSLVDMVCKGVLRYNPQEWDEGKVVKLIDGIRRRLESMALIKQRAELNKKRLECANEQEGDSYLKQINIIQQKLHELRRSRCQI